MILPISHTSQNLSVYQPHRPRRLHFPSAAASLLISLSVRPPHSLRLSLYLYAYISTSLSAFLTSSVCLVLDLLCIPVRCSAFLSIYPPLCLFRYTPLFCLPFVSLHLRVGGTGVPSHMSTFMSVWFFFPPVCLPVYLPLRLHVCFSISLFASQSICLSKYMPLSTHQPIHLSVHLSFCFFVYPLPFVSFPIFSLLALWHLYLTNSSKYTRRPSHKHKQITTHTHQKKWSLGALLNRRAANSTSAFMLSLHSQRSPFHASRSLETLLRSFIPPSQLLKAQDLSWRHGCHHLTERLCQQHCRSHCSETRLFTNVQACDISWESETLRVGCVWHGKGKRGRKDGDECTFHPAFHWAKGFKAKELEPTNFMPGAKVQKLSLRNLRPES